jgi:hypothetical protein
MAQHSRYLTRRDLEILALAIKPQVAPLKGRQPEALLYQSIGELLSEAIPPHHRLGSLPRYQYPRHHP